MRKTAFLMAAALLVFSLHGTALYAARGKAGPHRAGRYVEGELLVKYKSSVSTRSRALHMGSVGASLIRNLGYPGIEQVKLPSGLPVEEGAALFSQSPDVEYAEPNYIIKAAATPNDPRFGELWGLARINAPPAWDMTTGSASVIIAVIDSGVAYDHPDLIANMWTNTGETSCTNFVDDDGNGYIDDCLGWDFVQGDKDPMDINGHGTHVAGTIGAVGNNGTGVTGVNWSVSIMPVRSLDSSGTGDTAGAIRAINYARDNGARVINCSWGSYYFSQSLKAAIDAAPGVLFVCAAGNDGADTDRTPHYPSGYGSANIISVAATDTADVITNFSNFGAASVDVGAPGGSSIKTDPGILSTMPARETIWSDNFDDGNISDWVTGGFPDTWGVDSGISNSGSYSLSDSPVGFYLDYTNSWARAPAQSLLGESGCAVSYSINYHLEDFFDFLCVEASTDGSLFTTLGGGCFTGYSGGQWDEYTDDLTSFDDKGQVYVWYRLVSDFSVAYDGVYIDDVSINCTSSNYTASDYKEMRGTSMAAPHVSGIAGLMLDNPATSGFSPAELKHAIMFSADPVNSLAGKAASGGRASAFGALNTTDLSVLPPLPPSDLEVIPGMIAVLGWKDNSTDEVGFIVERAAGVGGPFVPIAYLPPGSVNHLDPGFTRGVTYYYRVRAYNANGESPYSRPASAFVPEPEDEIPGCFIATAAYGSSLAPEVRVLRRFRDERLMASAAGRYLVRLYYRHSPPLARIIRERPALRAASRALLTPVVYAVKYPHAALMGALLALALGGVAIKKKRRKN